ncbi:MAG: DNA (cytosine-5-)-methyltransferase [Candidatus Magasanikbacteria bacterium CG1_02_41_34]|uniref:DNA (cytosine-5-)-methyltransferase n=1 Tax=Candidatus Magasanikbacteria bacterium CG_4_10_14_0_2_um_filter_41_31 TaxID=1974639 RepID=A0A2M7V427_9BACT|nr:MAG: DNA (cytosine-5-)-methyltransferase [Candidatus Magasanikbacteria bacterium CG1_02_41_34]PIZ93272.1 MAG: DNA (cytosine-5-)-methyltransferase [Candidatus Magasanikbacteria bacterium CG_4_10_14_0_2_um_filter_41_31]
MKIEAIDLFCGIGGLTYGLRKAKIKVLAGLDNDESCAYAYEKNNAAKFIPADISEFDFKNLNKMYTKGSVRVLVGCAPCQPFSSHAFKLRKDASDARWNLLDHFIRGVKVVKPDIVSMENVRGVTKTEVFKNFVCELEKLGYSVDWKVVYAPNYGVPQNRSRLILLASRLGEISIPKETHTKDNYVTVGDIIRELPKIKAGKVSKQDYLHQAKKLEPINQKRMLQSKPGGSWRDWDKNLLPNCYKKDSGQTYTSVYGRMKWEDVSPTITTQFTSYGSGRFGHPEQNRALSIREGALLQTFPIDYDFGDFPAGKLSRHIGNAVPPQLGVVIGNQIKKHLEMYGK